MIGSSGSRAAAVAEVELLKTISVRVKEKGAILAQVRQRKLHAMHGSVVFY